MTKARTNADNASADIQGVTAGTGLSGGGTSGTVTLTNDMATTIDAKGDLVVGTGADTYSRLAVSDNGSTLVADSSTSTGLRWQGSQTAGKNGLINGAFDIWQRGTSINGSGFSYGADRWAFWRFNSGTGLNANQGSGLTGSQYTLKVQRIAGQTFTDAIYASYDMETADSYRFAGKTVTFSFYIRKGANYSGGDITAVIRSGTGTNQTLFNGYTGGANVASTTATINSTTTFQRVTLTGTVSSSATQIGVYITYTPTGTAGAADFIEIGQAQLELGSVATEFSRAGGTLAGELAACQRYYQRIGGQTYTFIGIGNASTASNGAILIPLTTQMRVSPTSIDYGGTLRITDQVSNFTANPITINTVQCSPQRLYVDVTSGSLTQFRTYVLAANNDANAYVGVSAEL